MEKITSLSQLDMNGTYSYADYLTWQFDERVEIINGKIFDIVTPNRKHQDISRELCGTFYMVFKKSLFKMYSAPFDVRLYDKKKSLKANKDIFTVVQPDICVICDEGKLDDKGCLGSPDLVVEILSPGNSSKEMRIKKDLYESIGVREYWVVFPDVQSIAQYVLDETTEKYPNPFLYSTEETVISTVFPQLQVNLIEIF